MKSEKQFRTTTGVLINMFLTLSCRGYSSLITSKFTDTRPLKGVSKRRGSDRSWDGTQAGLHHTAGWTGRAAPARRGQEGRPPSRTGHVTHWTRLKYSWGVLGGMEGSKPSAKSQGSTGNSRGINSSTAGSAGTHAMAHHPASRTSGSPRRRTRRRLWRGGEPAAGLRGVVAHAQTCRLGKGSLVPGRLRAQFLAGAVWVLLRVHAYTLCPLS